MSPTKAGPACQACLGGQIVAMLHVLVHEYWGVDLDRPWATAIDDVPVVITALEAVCVHWPLAEPPGE
ncbi:MAG: hypothetical protein H7210_04040 [Pyrinomonadaceae bacterium]|nr:hypothetical protein [Phycisphaerales bacterium]